MTARTTGDVYQQITDQIVIAIENGAGDWKMPWHRRGGASGRPANVLTGNAYRGVNVLALWAAAMKSGFASDTWGTYRQWQAKDAQVRKGEKATVVVFYKQFPTGQGEDAEAELSQPEHRIFARASWVFNADQIDDWVEPVAEQPASEVRTILRAEEFIAVTGAAINHGGTVACYDRLTDTIRMPARERFVGSATSSPTECYYATLFHELTHWTGEKSRCDRQFGKRFGDDAYVMEELVAELGAAFLCADLRVTNTPRPDHAAYAAHWLKVMREDKRAIFTAASKAAQAADYLAARSSGKNDATAH